MSELLRDKRLSEDERIAELVENIQRSSVKVVHFWGMYNPLFAVTSREQRTLQAAAMLRDSSLWRWYRKWWRAHQRAMNRTMGSDYEVLMDHCNSISHLAQKGVLHFPLLLHAGLDTQGTCYHPVCF